MPGRILVVDDHPLNAQLLQAQLESGGYQVVACHDGLTALAELLRQPFDAVLLDLMMPPPDGLETCRMIRATELYPGLPIVFVTALVGPEVGPKVRAAGGDRLITKPVSCESMLACVAEVLHAGRGRTPAGRANSG